MTSTLYILDEGADDDGFQLSAELQGADTDQDRIDVAIVIDTSGSTRDSSGSDFTGDGKDESILEAELIAALEVFDSYIAAGYEGDEVVISLVTFASDADDRGYYTLDDRDDFVAMLDDIKDDGPNGGTDFDEGLKSAEDAFEAAGADPDGTNIVLFMSDGYPTESSDNAIRNAAEDLEDNYNAVIRGIGIGDNSSLTKLNILDNTPGGAVQVENGQELVDIIVEPLTDADFLRFEIEIEGVDANGDPLTQTITLQESDAAVIKTPLGWSIDKLEIDPNFIAPQDLTVTVNGIFAEDPGNPGSGEQYVTTMHNIPLVICFTPGVMILTPTGEVAIEDLGIGDRVITRDHGVQRIRWIGATTLPAGYVNRTSAMRPVLVRAGALGPDQPVRDMRLSRQHRILVRDWRADLLFGKPDGVLVPVVSLLNDSTIIEDRPTGPVTYIHMAFDTHEVVYADGIEAESFHPSERSVSGLTAAQREELFTLFPELRGAPQSHAFDAARSNLRARDARVLAETPED
ncbi:Hint domain-containing protein [Marinibacterium sp. SX1]|uniref:Hint domain-containing protein n=1 Tax=Marinibacterium sp. SX1 TaxID=3388424 RepID=UPI003D16F1F7